MKVLISPADPDEALVAWRCGADIIDVKNTAEGSLGANFPWVIREVRQRITDPAVVVSATLGDLPAKPGTAALAALGALVSGATYLKAGLHGPRDIAEGTALMRAVVRTAREHGPGHTVVAAGYADHARFGGLSPEALVAIAAESGADVVMLDTLVKDGRGLRDALDDAALIRFCTEAHAAGLQVALAGAVRAEDLPALRQAGADVVGVRGAVCRGQDRRARVDEALARAFMARVQAHRDAALPT